MSLNIAIVGNAENNVGFAVAADLSLAGHRVTLAHWPDQAASLEPVQKFGGFQVVGDATEFVSGKTGTARLHAITTDLAVAVNGADLIFLDVPQRELTARFGDLLAHLGADQFVHVNSHGGWPALRLAPLLRQAGREDVTLTESAAPTVAAGYDNGTIMPHALRRHLGVAAFPANRTSSALAMLRQAYPSLEAAGSVLQTGFETMNFLVHPAIAMLNIGYYDLAEQAGERVSFYGAGNTPHTARFAEALDGERAPVCAAYGVEFHTLRQHICRYYGSDGENVHDAIRNCAFYQKLPPAPADTWRSWLADDLPLAHVPFVAFAELASIAVPLHRAVVSVGGAVLGTDFWASGLTLARLGLADAGVSDVRHFVEHGYPAR